MAIPPSEIANALTEINKLSDDELKDLLNAESNERYDEFIAQTDLVKTLEAERDVWMASVRSLAEFNLARQPDYDSDRSKLEELVSESNITVEGIKEKEVKLLELTKKTSREATLKTILEATTWSEEESEIIAKKFLESNIDYDTFISRYCDARKLAHSRRIKAERLKATSNL